MRRKAASKGEANGKPGWMRIHIACILLLFTFVPMAILLHASSSMSIRLNNQSFSLKSEDISNKESLKSNTNRSALSLENKEGDEILASFITPQHMPYLTFQDFALNFTYSSFASRTAEAPDIVVGMAQDMDPKYFVVFSSSLRSVNRKCAVYILMNEIALSPLVLEIAAKNQINIVIFRVKDGSQFSKYHPSTLRWMLIPRLLTHLNSVNIPLQSISSSNIKHTIPAVLLIDVRDSYLQGDPFSYLGESTRSSSLHYLHAFTGVESVTIEQCGWNGGWVKDCFGSDMLKQIGRNHIICSGVSLGDMNTVMTYVNTMAALVSGDQPEFAFFPRCERNGVDQGAHNVVVHTSMIPNIKVYSQSESPVSNMQAKLYERKIHALADGEEMQEIVGINSHQRILIAHQYDRNTEFQNYLFKKFVYWIDVSDLVGEWASNSLCSKYAYSQNIDAFKGICDLGMKGGVTSPSGCCQHCTTNSKCTSFVYVSGTCFLKSCTRPGTPIPLNGAWSAWLHHL